MIHSYPQVASTRLSGDEDEWRVLIRWKQEAATNVYTIAQALDVAARLQQTKEHEVAPRIRDAAYALRH